MEEEKKTRREFVISPVKVLAAAVATTLAAAVVPVVLTCQDYMENKRSPDTYQINYGLFGGEVGITRTEKVKKGILSKTITSIEFDFDIKARGDYILEGWVLGYRARDTKEEEWRFKASETPGEFKRDVYSRVYRIEASRVKDGKLEKDSVVLNYYEGELGSGIYEVGHRH